jgi:hypothetical protein
MSNPKLTARTLAHYMELQRPAQREELLREQRTDLGKKHFAPYYQTSIVAIRSHHSGNGGALDTAYSKLKRALDEATLKLQGAEGKERSKLLNEVAKLANNARVCNDYRENFSDRQLEHRLHRYEAITVGGVTISGEATLLGDLMNGKKTMKCAVVVDTHDEPPSDDYAHNQLELLYAIESSRVGHC